MQCKPNIAHYLSNNKFLVSYMEFHVDNNELDSKGCYTFRILDIDPKFNAFLVHWKDKQFVNTELVINKIITFQANRRHAVLPKSTALEVVKQQSVIPATQWINASLNDSKNYPAMEIEFL